MTSEKVMTNVNTVSTPVYDSVRTSAFDGIPSSASRPPHHFYIYGQLCWEFGADPRSSDFGIPPPHRRATAFSSRPARPAWPTELAHALAEGHRRAGAHSLPWWEESLRLA